MKVWKRIMAGLLCIILLTVLGGGCSAKKEAVEPKTAEGAKTPENSKAPENSETPVTEKVGGYVEQEIGAPVFEGQERTLSAFIGADHNWTVYTAEYLDGESKVAAVYVYRKPFDSENPEAEWKREKVDWIYKTAKSLKTPKGFDISLSDIVEGEDGTIYAFFERNHTKKMELSNGETINVRDFSKSTQLWIYGENKKKPVKITGPAESYGASRMAVAANGDILLMECYSGTTYHYSGEDGKLYGQIEYQSRSDYEKYGRDFWDGKIVSGNMLIGQDGNHITFYNLERKKVEKTIDCEPSEGLGVCVAVGRKGGILLSDKNGLHRLTAEGSLWEGIIDGFQTSFGRGESELTRLWLLGEKEDQFAGILKDMTVFSNFPYRLVQYVYDADKPVLNQTLSVYSLYYNMSLQESIDRYQKEHMDVKVDYIVGKEDDGSPENEYIRGLNTELLNGKGPDLLLLDGLPAQSYEEKGVLEDISGIAAPMLESKGLLSNIVKSYVREDGKIYEVPLGFRAPWAMGAPAAVESMKSLESLAGYIKAGNETPVMQKTSYEALTSLLLAFEYPTLIPGKDVPEEAVMERFLENLKTVAENIHAEESLQGDTALKRDRTSMAGFQVDYINPRYRTLEHILEKKVELSVIPVANFNHLSDGYFLKEEEGMACSFLNGAFIPECLIGINHNSEEKERAQEFVRYLLEGEADSYFTSPEAGSFYHFWSFPVNTKALKAKFDNRLRQKGSFRQLTANEKSYEITPPSDENANEFYEGIQKLDRPIMVNQEIADCIVEGAVSYLAGRKELSQAAGEICGKLKLYQQERQ